MFFTPVKAPPEPAQVALCLRPWGGLGWLDGGLEHGREGRWSFLAAAPVEVREAHFGAGRPWDVLRDLGCHPRGATWDGPLPLSEVPRWIGYASYDAHWAGGGKTRHRRDPELPVVRLARYAAFYAYDHRERRGYVLGEHEPAVAALRGVIEVSGKRPAPTFRAGRARVTDAEEHAARIRRALDHMRAGDIYQVNLARRWQVAFEGDPLGLWLRMRALSPVPLGCYLEADNHAVLACTMERFLRYRASDRALWTSPIKGTLPRGDGDDPAAAGSMRSDPKEHAEHSMVVDLMRNDIGRVAEYGSVRVEPLMDVLPFAGLSHLVSTIHGTAREDVRLDELLEQTFPPGSVTGTPKSRALEVIESLEEFARGVYCGAVGFVDQTGGCSWAVAIRTAVVKDGMAEYFAGGGLVVDSDAEREVLETELKARVFLDAIR